MCIMISNYARWIFRQQTYLLLIATAVYVTSDNSTGNCNFHTYLHQSFSECTIVIEAKCFNITTAKLIDSQDISTFLQGAVLQVYTSSPTNNINYSSIQLHYLSNLIVTQSNARWHVSLPEDVTQSAELVCVRTSLTIPEDNVTIVPLRDNYCINNCIQSEEPIITTACEGISEALCLEVTLATHSEANDIVAIIVTDGVYYLRKYNSSSQLWYTPILLPSCVTQDTTSLHRSLQWFYYNSSNHGNNCSPFVPTNVMYSLAGTLIAGNKGLILSVGTEDFYILQLPREANLSSFSSLSTVGGQFVFIITYNQTVNLYYGLISSAEVLQIDNNEIQTVLNYWNSTLDNIESIVWNDTSHLIYIILSDNSSFPLPFVPLLTKSWQIHTSTIEHRPIALPFPYPFSTSLYHELITQPVDTIYPYYNCPFKSVLINAQVCSVVTRTQLSLQDNYTSSNTINYTQLSLAYNECNITTDWLPWSIYLSYNGSYNFTLGFQLQAFDSSSLLLSSTISQTGVIKLSLFDYFNPADNTKSYTVIIKDSLLKSSLQVESGYHVTMTTVSLQVWNAGLSCISNSSGSMKIHNPGFYNIAVRVGCPPGLLFIYDTEESIGHEEQYCTQKENLTCHFFENDYHPVFKVLDEVTGITSTYTGKYSLRVLAGGILPNEMKPFDVTTNIESTIWMSSSDYYSNVTIFDTANNGIIWICSHNSPCGDLLPKDSGTPEYCLLLEASNLGVGADSSYCHFSVQFTICIHGIRMGLTGVISSFLLSILIFFIVLMIGFVLWFWKIKFKDYSTGWKGQANTADTETNRFNTIRRMIKCHEMRVEEETVEETIIE